MKKNILFGVLALLLGSVCHAEDITIRYNGSKAKVTQTAKDSVKVTVKGASVNIESLYKSHKLTVLMKGKSDNGQLTMKTAGKAKIKLDGLELTSQEGAPLCLKNKKKVEIVASKGTTNRLAITACNDTANNKAAVIWAKDKLLFSGKGTLYVVATGQGCRGIKTQKDITIEELTLNVTTSGDNLGEKPFSFGGFPGMPEGGFQMPEGGFPGFPGMPDDSTMRARFQGFGGFPGMPDDSTMRARFQGFGGFPGMPDDSTMRARFQGFGGFPGMPEGGFPDFGNFPMGNDSIEGGFGGGFGGKHKYVAATKGIASKGKITINSGKVYVHTETAGAEGIEGKEGISFNGGDIFVTSTDDAINANATIEFNGANVTAISSGNDAVDSNPKGGFFIPFGGNNNQDTEPAIIIRGGTVYAWSQVGSPEEGIDCDFAPLVIEGGTVFSVGGGMGEMPSVPNNENAKQPTVLLIGLNVTQKEPISILDANGKLLDTVTIPFAMRRSASLVTNPKFKLGSTYTVKTKGYEKTFTLNEPFTTVR